VRTGRLRPAESERLFRAAAQLERTRLFIDDAPGQTILTIGANARRMKRLRGIGLIIIDYLQLITMDAKKENRQEQVAHVSRRLKLLARELRIPVVVLAQLNRQVETRADQRPKLSDIRESGALEQDADMVMMLHRPDSYERGQHEGLVDLIVAKHRNGPVGDVPLVYVKQHMRFESYGPLNAANAG
jgi:replicative DNA helicase